ncbi:SDR family oxidoreductase [Notoacmeibacter sp. MSK16QG-6]|uniref:SDR family oxidoreductase n=1 Tax=Notoacmeibacter sp. MSK16QG-6 TaxID=2957982 RepID=UPI00209EF4DF|nr:SDR family oxidoreductase [Notoacmeibacter sp. MSK16QG-6]MCP1199300.1 SDR family oxidoreductase [Notoacmeibacter sp. MSK16QG-6]
MKVLIIGGYGLIGAACLRALRQAGFAVTGVGRDVDAARKVDPDGEWIIRDVTKLSVEDWQRLTADKDVVINASGALQDGARDSLHAIHVTAVERLTEALADTSTRLVHISAVGASQTAKLDFFATKGQGETIIRQSSADWVILRPALVIGQEAYGGTALLRAAAALPMLAPHFIPDVTVQTVFLNDVAQAVVQAARGEIPHGTLADLTEPEGRSLSATIRTIRRWIGFADPRATIPVPTVFMSILAKCADALGYLGWRSPLRSNALAALADGIEGDPDAWLKAGGTPCRSLDETLSAMPATVQERWFARLYLLFPLGVALLSVFWILSGIIGVTEYDRAAAILTTRGMSGGLAPTAVFAGSIMDIALGLAILWRPWVRAASLGMVIVSLGYLVGGSMMTPDLWADPLGPFVKVLPSLGLALFVAAIAKDR